MARLIPPSCRTLIDLGCGTGLELDEIFKLLPDIQVTGIDLTQAMLDKLRAKHSGKSIRLIRGSYFDIDLGISGYDCAVSFQTLHHFSREAKIGLYQRIHAALKNGGLYVECDYMVENKEDEDFYRAENARIRNELGIPEEAFYHYDTPCAEENQIDMLRAAGFATVEKRFRMGNSTILLARK